MFIVLIFFYNIVGRPFQIGNTENALYLHQFPMYMQLLLDNLNSDNGNTFELSAHATRMGVSPSIDGVQSGLAPVNRVIPALLFSANPSTLRSTHHLIFNFYKELGINQCHACYLVHLVDSTDKSELAIHHRTVDALKHLPQSKASWSSGLAKAMKIVLRLLLCQSWDPPFYFINKHERWLKRTKPSKHFSMGSPQLTSRFYDYGRRRDWSRPTTKYNYNLPYYYNFPSVYGPYTRDLGKRRERIMCDKGYDCIVLLEAVIFFLRKADHRAEVAELARRLLPATALWFPKLMKRARTEMDQYVHRWEGAY